MSGTMFAKAVNELRAVRELRRAGELEARQDFAGAAQRYEKAGYKFRMAGMEKEALMQLRRSSDAYERAAQPLRALLDPAHSSQSCQTAAQVSLFEHHIHVSSSLNLILNFQDLC